MFDTYTRTRAYVPVILVSTMGLSDGWQMVRSIWLLSLCVTVCVARPNHGSQKLTELASYRLTLSSIEFVFTGAPGFSLRFPSTFKQHY